MTVTTVTESPQAEPPGPLLDTADQRPLVAEPAQVGDRLLRRIGLGAEQQPAEVC